MGPPEPTPAYTENTSEGDPDGMSEVEIMKFKCKFDTYLIQTDKFDMQLKQVFLKYYGQANKDIRASLKEDAEYERAYDTKDVTALQKC